MSKSLSEGLDLLRTQKENVIAGKCTWDWQRERETTERGLGTARVWRGRGGLFFGPRNGGEEELAK